MKYLTDKEILNWNNKLEESGYKVYPKMNTRSSQPDISYRQIITNAIGNTFVETTEPFVRYKFIFSVSSNRVQYFFEILSKLLLEPFGTKSSYISQNNQSDRITSIEVSEKIIENKSEDRHRILDKEYVKFTYQFAGKLGSIMAYVSYLEDAINLFSMIWGYQEDGSEVCLLKYPIGTIVSPKSDKSLDLLVLDYKFHRFYDDYLITYIASEMKKVGTVITYGDCNEYKEGDLGFSRNNRIDDLLEN